MSGFQNREHPRLLRLDFQLKIERSRLYSGENEKEFEPSSSDIEIDYSIVHSMNAVE